MPYISSNGEVYDDEEIYFPTVVNDEYDDLDEFEFLPADELILRWEKRLFI
jgi:hypothetical protein